MSDLLDRLQDMVDFKHDDMDVAREAIEEIVKLEAQHDEQAATIARLWAKREALQARVAKLERALDAAARVLHKAGEQFSEYAKLHAAKGTAVSDLKAAANKQWAELCFSAYWRAVEGGKDE